MCALLLKKSRKLTKTHKIPLWCFVEEMMESVLIWILNRFDVFRSNKHNIMANRVSNEQLEALLEFLQEHPTLAKGIGLGARSKETVDRQWKQLAMNLNSIGSGSHKTGERWKKYWADIKHKSKTRLTKYRQDSTSTGGGPSTQENITEIDKKILSIIGEQAVFGDVEHRVPIFNNIEDIPMDTSIPEGHNQSNVEMVEVVIVCEDSQEQFATVLPTCPSPTEQTSKISISKIPENAPGCSTTHTHQKSALNLHTGLQSPVSRPVRHRPLKPHYNPNQRRIKTQSQINPEWVKELEGRRVEAEIKLANSASIMAEAVRLQSEYFKTQAEVLLIIAKSLEKVLSKLEDKSPPKT